MSTQEAYNYLKRLGISKETGIDQALLRFNHARAHIRSIYGKEPKGEQIVKQLQDAFAALYPDYQHKFVVEPEITTNAKPEKKSYGPSHPILWFHRMRSFRFFKWNLFRSADKKEPINQSPEYEASNSNIAFDFAAASNFIPDQTEFQFVNHSNIYDMNNKISTGGFVERFFLWCSGAVPEVLAQCPTEINKYLGIGTLVFLTSILAGTSGGYALYFVFNDIYISILGGCFWALLIFTLNYFIVTVMRNQGTFWEKAAVALPRIALSLVISMVIALPLELRIFEKEILENMQKTRKEKSEKEIQTLEEDKNALDTKNNNYEVRKKELFELTRRASISNIQVGRIGRKISANIEKFIASVDSEMNEINKNIDAVTNEKKAKQSEIDSIKNDLTIAWVATTTGLLDRMDALKKIEEENYGMKLVVFFITLLFILLEMVPVLTKLFLSPGPYDYKLKDMEVSYEIENKLLPAVETDIKKVNLQKTKEYNQTLHAFMLEKKLEAEKKVLEIKLNHWVVSEIKKPGSSSTIQEETITKFSSNGQSAE